MSDRQEDSRGDVDSENQGWSGGKVARRVSIFRDLVSYLWRQKMWWMIPMVVILAGFTLLAVIAGSSGIAPFVYTLF